MRGAVSDNTFKHDAAQNADKRDEGAPKRMNRSFDEDRSGPGTGPAKRVRRLSLLIAVSAGVAILFAAVSGLSVDRGTAALAQNDTQDPGSRPIATGSESGLPLPRFVSLKASQVNVRRGPSRTHAVEWVFLKAGLPVEVVAEFENWRRIRDAEGEEGWVHHQLLSGRRTALVAPWSQGTPVPLRRDDSDSAVINAYLEPGVLINLRECDGNWCEADMDQAEGFIPQDQLWGVYPGENVE